MGDLVMARSEQPPSDPPRTPSRKRARKARRKSKGPQSPGTSSSTFSVNLLVACTIMVVAGEVMLEANYQQDQHLYSDPLTAVTRRVETRIAALRKSWSDMRTTLPEIFFEPERPGARLRTRKIYEELEVKAKHPVIMIPGVVTSKLELWEGKPCAESDFRHQYWGSTKMLEALLLNRRCWLQHIALNQTTGLDPEGIKLRVADGMSAADFLIGDYWVWERVIHNLADIGHDPNTMYLAAYDWRLASVNLEKRDLYFSRLKFQVEIMKRQTGEKAYIVGHSMGSIVVHFFLQWVESPLGGNGGPQWVDEHVAGFVNIAGPLLGVPKTLSALISGEMRDTAELNTVMEYIKENLISTSDLLRLFRSFSSLASMIPKGSDRIWGNTTRAPEDTDVHSDFAFTHGVIVDMIDEEEFDQWKEAAQQHEEMDAEGIGHRETASSATSKSIHIDDDGFELSECSDRPDDVEPIQDLFLSNDIVFNQTNAITSEGFIRFMEIIAPKYLEKVSQHDSWGIAEDFSTGQYNHPRYWNNPLESQLPHAPDMKIFSLYGVGKATERSYAYKTATINCDSIPVRIAKHLSNAAALVSSGVRMADGDGTVPLLSAGFMSVKGWKDPLYNPSNITCITREYKHEPESLAGGGLFSNRFRGGRTTADHVDIMGNHDLITDILLIVSGHGDAVEERILSNIQELADSITLPSEESRSVPTPSIFELLGVGV